MPASGTGQLNYAATMPQSVFKYLQNLIRTPANFQSVQASAAANYAHPSLQLGPTGQWLDPQQANTVNESNYLGQRSDIASQDIRNKQQYAGLLGDTGHIMASITNAIPFLQAANLGGAGSAGGGAFSSMGL